MSLAGFVGTAGGLIFVVWRYGVPRLEARAARARVRRRCRIHGGPLPPLNPTYIPLRRAPAPCERKARRFEALGFVRLGAYRAEETGRRGVTLLHPDGLLATTSVGLSPRRRTSVEAYLEGGEVLIVNDRPAPPNRGALPPWLLLRHSPHATPAALLAALREEIGGRPITPLTPESFVEVTREEVRREVEWLMVHGPYRPEAVACMEELSGTAADPETLALLKKAHEASGVYPRG